jgi:putative PIN family toxin of toxin-antitoxin system
LRVVLDTNILVSAFVFPGGVPESVYRLALEGRISVVTSPALLAELGRVLADKFDWESDRVTEAVELVARLAEVVRPEVAIREISADPSDDRVLEAAAAGGVEVIVSGDRHLLDLRTWLGIDVVRAKDLLEGFQT